MVRIARVALLPWAIPLVRPLATAHGPIAVRRGFVVVLAAAHGLAGLGEAAPHPAAPPAALATTHAALRAATTWLVGASLERLDALLGRVAALDAPAACGLDMALHDLAARAAGRSVAALLGERAGAPASGAAPRAIRTSALLGGDTPAACAAAAAAAAARGFVAAKIKVGPDVRAAVARVAAARAAAPTLRLRADANGCWDAATATRAAAALAAYDLEWLEQPVAAHDVAGMVRVRRESGVALAADEAVTGPEAVATLAGAGAADVIVLKLVQVGGLAAASASARVARAAGVGVTVTTSIDTSLGTAAALHLAAALPGPLHDCGVATGGLLAGDLVCEPLLDAAAMAPPRGPGLGVGLDPARLVRWREGSAA